LKELSRSSGKVAHGPKTTHLHKALPGTPTITTIDGFTPFLQVAQIGRQYAAVLSSRHLRIRLVAVHRMRSAPKAAPRLRNVPESPRKPDAPGWRGFDDLGQSGEPYDFHRRSRCARTWRKCFLRREDLHSRRPIRGVEGADGRQPGPFRGAEKHPGLQRLEAWNRSVGVR